MAVFDADVLGVFDFIFYGFAASFMRRNRLHPPTTFILRREIHFCRWNNMNWTANIIFLNCNIFIIIHFSIVNLFICFDLSDHSVWFSFVYHGLFMANVVHSRNKIRFFWAHINRKSFPIQHCALLQVGANILKSYDFSSDTLENVRPLLLTWNTITFQCYIDCVHHNLPIVNKCSISGATCHESNPISAKCNNSRSDAQFQHNYKQLCAKI